MARRSYGQYCGLAYALDLIGERWTLLVIRDLAVGPRRFTEILEGLDGLGPNLLTERLRHLEDAGIVRRSAVPRPDRGVAYELTGDGERLAQAISPLGIWGATRLEARGDLAFRPEWLMFSLRAAFKPEASAGVHDCYEFRVDGVQLWVTIDDGEIDVSATRPREPDFVATLDVPTLAAIGAGTLSVADAIRSGAASFEGDGDAMARALLSLGPRSRPVSASA